MDELKEETLEDVLQKIYTRLAHIEAVLGYVLTIVNDPKQSDEESPAVKVVASPTEELPK